MDIKKDKPKFFSGNTIKFSWKNLINKIKLAKKLLFLDKDTKYFIKHNKKVWRNYNHSKYSKSVILVDLYGVSETIIAYSYFLNILGKKYNAAIKYFVQRTKIPPLALDKLYRSFNASGRNITSLSKEQKRRQEKMFNEVMPTLRSKQDIFDLKVSGIWIGVDIYETYLKRYNKPTVFIDDPRLHEVIKEGIGLVIFWSDYFSKNKVTAVVVSHDCYLYFDAICKVAYQRQVPVYLPNPVYPTFTDRPHGVHSYFGNYRKMFRKLSTEKQRSAISLAKKQLERRLSGEVSVNMPYVTKSAFTVPHNEKRILKESKDIKVLICTHCFYDNPHGYGGMLFLDFYEWLRYLGKISERTDYDWYLKVHPDPLPGTLEIIKEIITEFPRITIIPHETSHHQLAKEGVNFILTVYGSVGHECPALGIQVINAAYNPHVAYDFNWHPQSLDEYEYYLLNLDKLHKEVKMEDLYEFYYIHYYYKFADDLIFKSYEQLLSDLTREQRIGSTVYGYFLDQLTDTKHREIIHNMQKFIDSGKHHYWSRGPE